MKKLKRITTLLLALVMTASLAVSAYAATVVVKYKVYVYTSQLTFKQYDYSSSTTPSTRNLTILADSNLGSGSALYHMKYVNGAVAYCIQPGVRSDDSSNYVQGSSGCWYNLPAAVQSGIALALSCGYPSAEYGTAYGDSNSSDIINAEKIGRDPGGHLGPYLRVPQPVHLRLVGQQSLLRLRGHLPIPHLCPVV